MSRFILVRHGETEWNRRGLFQGQQDSPLTPNGLSQALKVGQRLKQRPIDFILSSDLGRARQTTEAINQSLQLPVKWDARIRERNYGHFEGLSHDEIRVKFPQGHARMRQADTDWKPEGGESHRQLVKRVNACFEDWYRKCPDATILTVTHGGVLHASMSIWAGINRRSTPFSINNSSIAEYSYQGRRWRLETWGDTAHLEDRPLDEL